MPYPGTRIAIVDDDPGVLKALARLLSACSFQPQTYPSARLFLQSLSDGTPDCLVLDLQMPEMTGLELQNELARSGIKIPVVVITAHDERRIRQECESAGAIDFLCKPLNQRTLIAAINNAIGAR
jgi:FixJ family two-component response regulator